MRTTLSCRPDVGVGVSGVGLGITTSLLGVGVITRRFLPVGGLGMWSAAIELEVGGVVGLAVRSKFADLLAVLHHIGLNKVLRKRSSSKRGRVSKKSGTQSERTTRS